MRRRAATPNSMVCGDRLIPERAKYSPTRLGPAPGNMALRSVQSDVANWAGVALERTGAIVAHLPDVERTNNPLGCYYLVRRKIFAQVTTVVDSMGQPMTAVALRPDPEEREALIAVGHPYLSRGPWDDRLGRIAVLIEASTDWDEIAELVTDSYRLTAPKKLVAQLDASSSSARVRHSD